MQKSRHTQNASFQCYVKPLDPGESGKSQIFLRRVFRIVGLVIRVNIKEKIPRREGILSKMGKNS
jgi:hypothetical protein